MADARTIYEQLTGVKVDDATIEQLDFTKNTFIDSKSIEYWKGVITISKIIDASRTYPHGLEIPETGAVAITPVDPGGFGFVYPSGTELFRIKGINATATGGAATVTVSYWDGSTAVDIRTGLTIATTGTIIDLNEIAAPPITISNKLWLRFTETGGGNAVTFDTAYFKVSL